MKLHASIPSVLFALAITVVSSRGQTPTSYPTDINPAVLSANATRDLSEVGGSPRPDILGKTRSQALQQAIGLSDELTFKIERILTQEAADCQAMGPPPWPPASPIRQRARDDIRALLTPEQRAKFNLVPESHGGGLFGLSPWEQLARLDKLVHLAPEQKPPVLEALIDRTENLMENHGPEKVAKRDEIRRVMYTEIRAMLTAEQQKILDASLEKHGAKSLDSGNS
jgi:hypothetical protein